MRPELQQVIDDLESARQRLDALAGRVAPDQWALRTDPARWSVAECVEHLNTTSRAFLPPLRQAVEAARRLGSPAPARYRRDVMGWLLWRMLPPPVRMRVRAPAAFVPGATAPREQMVAEFAGLQDQLVDTVRSADGLPITGVRIVSPFASNMRYSLYSALTIVAPHQHRHLWQAEQLLPR
jgi:hypothetical protein